MYNNIRESIDKFKSVSLALTENSHSHFLGYHSSRKEYADGLHKGNVLDLNTYEDIIPRLYSELITDWDKNIETNNVRAMNNVFLKRKLSFTFVSSKPIEASSFQYLKYKYGNFLYEVYGDGTETVLDDPNEINAEIVVSKNPLFFKQVK